MNNFCVIHLLPPVLPGQVVRAGYDPEAQLGQKVKFPILNQPPKNNFCFINFSPPVLPGPVVRVRCDPEAQLGQK